MSQRAVEVLSTFTPNLEVYSVDENFLQIESVLRLYPSAIEMGQQILHAIPRTERVSA
jgi:DNA polymerase V